MKYFVLLSLLFLVLLSTAQAGFFDSSIFVELGTYKDSAVCADEAFYSGIVVSGDGQCLGQSNGEDPPRVWTNTTVLNSTHALELTCTDSSCTPSNCRVSHVEIIGCTPAFDEYHDAYEFKTASQLVYEEGTIFVSYYTTSNCAPESLVDVYVHPPEECEVVGERHTHWTCSNGIADYYECDGVDNKTCSESCKPTIEVEENKCILSTADFNYITVGCSNPFKNLPSSTSSSSSSTSSVSTTSTPAGSSTTTSSGVTLVSVTYILGLCILAVLF